MPSEVHARGTMLPGSLRKLLAIALALSSLFWSVTASSGAQLHAKLHVPRGIPGRSTFLSTCSILLTAEDGTERRAWIVDDGTFAFEGLAAGSYILDVVGIGLMYPQYRVDAHPGSDTVSMSIMSNKMSLEHGLVLIPLGEAKYYQSRKPFNIKGLLFSPYGIMICVAVFAIFVGPSMKMDPEEMKKMQEEMKDSPLGFLVQGATGGQSSAAPASSQSTQSSAGGGRGRGGSASGGRKSRR